jgi:isopenicillin N synthase-like dioxygenase
LAHFEAASAEERRTLGAKVDAICRGTGFLAVSGHGVSQATIDAIWTRAEAFFALPVEQKLAAKVPYPGYPYGYLPPESESLARSRGVEAPPDQKESFNGGPDRAPARLTDPEALAFCFAPTIWPETPPGFRDA